MDPVHEELLQALWRAADVTRSRLAQVAEDSGVTFQQLMVLRILAAADEGGMPTLEIVRRMVERAPGITGLIDRLVRQGLVERLRSDEDRRQVRCRLTGDGRALLDQVTPSLSAASRDSLANLTSQEVGVLRHLALRLSR